MGDWWAGGYCFQQTVASGRVRSGPHRQDLPQNKVQRLLSAPANICIIVKCRIPGSRDSRCRSKISAMDYLLIPKLVSTFGHHIIHIPCVSLHHSISYFFAEFDFLSISHVQFSWAQSCPTLCDPMDCNAPGFPVHHQLPELAQIYVHRVSDAIQPSHPLWSPSPSAFNLSQHQGLFQWVSSLKHVAKVLEFQLQHQSFQWIFRTDFL